MRLTQFSDYSLRLLMYLADRPETSCTIGEIATWYGISKPHLVKVAHNLVKLGYVTSTRGKGGGLRLAVPAGKINIAALVKRTEPDFYVVECFDKATNTCRVTRSPTPRPARRRAAPGPAVTTSRAALWVPLGVSMSTPPPRSCHRSTGSCALISAPARSADSASAATPGSA